MHMEQNDLFRGCDSWLLAYSEMGEGSWMRVGSKHMRWCGRRWTCGIVTMGQSQRLSVERKYVLCSCQQWSCRSPRMGKGKRGAMERRHMRSCCPSWAFKNLTMATGKRVSMERRHLLRGHCKFSLPVVRVGHCKRLPLGHSYVQQSCTKRRLAHGAFFN